MISMVNATKKYGHTVAVRSVSFHVPKGQILGLLGQNGAGKTTILNMLAGYIPPTSGCISIGGADMLDDPEHARMQLGYMPEIVPLYPEMTVGEFLAFCCALKRVVKKDIPAHVEDVMKTCSLSHMRHHLIATLSKGYRQRVGFAQALCGAPGVLLLDEPTAGFDPAQATEFRQLIGTLAGQHTIIFSSHILSEIEAVCDRVIILRAGEIAFDQPMKTIQSDEGDSFRLRIGKPAAFMLPKLNSLPSIQKVHTNDAVSPGITDAVVEVSDPVRFSRELITLLSAADAPLMCYAPNKQSLEEIFLHAVNPLGVLPGARDQHESHLEA